MAKYFLIIGLIVGLIFSVLFVNKLRNWKSDAEAFQRRQMHRGDSPEEPLRTPSSKDGAGAPSAQLQRPPVVFAFEEGDALFSRKDSPWSSPKNDLQPGRATSQGFVVDARGGVARVQTGPDSTTYVVTDTGRPRHRFEVFTGFTYNGRSCVVYGDFEEATSHDPHSRIAGAFVGKTVTDGIITLANPSLIRVDRWDGGVTIISPRTRKDLEEQGEPIGDSPEPASSTPRTEAGPSVLKMSPPPEPPRPARADAPQARR